MNRGPLSLTSLLLVLLISLSTACDSRSSDATDLAVDPNGWPRTFVDTNGDVATVHGPIERIVTFHHQHAEMLAILGLEDKVVGVRDTFASQVNRYPILHSQPSVGGSPPDLETIIALEPDVIIAYGWFPAPDVLDAHLAQVLPHTTVLRVGFTGDRIGEGYVGIEAAREEVLAFASLFDDPEVMERAQEYLEWHDTYVGIVTERISGVSEEQRVRVFLESSERSYGIATTRLGIGFGHPAHGLVELAGGSNIGAGHIPLGTSDSEYNDIQVEFVLLQNPDVIVGRPMGVIGDHGSLRPWERSDDEAVKAYYLDIKQTFRTTEAASDGRIYIVTNDWAISPNYPSALVALAAWFYPELFADLNPFEVFREYVEMARISPDVLEHYSFTYPALR